MPQASIIPLDVPWMVSPSVSGLVVRLEEAGDTKVWFNASLKSGVDPRGVIPNLENPRVVVTFTSGMWASFWPTTGDEGAIDFRVYDQSRLPLAQTSPEEYLDALDVLWVRNQRCPNPGVFEIESSAWLAESGASRYGCRHYVVGGREARFEVLARGFSWEYTST